MERGFECVFHPHREMGRTDFCGVGGVYYQPSIRTIVTMGIPLANARETEMNIFRLAIMGVIAITLVAVLLQIINLPFIEQPGIEKIRGQLKTAQAQPGIALGEPLSFSAGTTVAGKTFDDGIQITSMYCNSPVHCCPQGESCDNTIEWENTVVRFKKDVKVHVSSRCNTITNTFVCTVYFGDAPGQLVFDNVSFAPTYDIRGGLPTIQVTLRNKGDVAAFIPAISSKMSVLFIQDEREQKVRAEELDAGISLPQINPGQSHTVDFTLNVLGEGRYTADIIAVDEHAGQVSKTITFSVIRSSGGCRANTAQENDLFWIEESLCGKRYYCSECERGSDCVEQWFQQNGSNLEVGNSNYAFEHVTCQ
jgi:hypothetical protein